MKFRKSLCILLGLMTVMAVGCNNNETDSRNVILYNSGEDNSVADTTEYFQVVKTFYGESASFGDMTVTVTEVADPKLTMPDSGKMALFFKVTIDNGTEETVTTNYLNNFALTVDDTYYEASECFTIPVMKQLYDFYGTEAFKDEIAAGESFTGYLAAEVDPNFGELELHYIPKTTDRGSRISVALTRDNMTDAVK